MFRNKSTLATRGADLQMSAGHTINENIRACAKPHVPAHGKPPKKMREVPKSAAPKTKKNRNRTPPIMGFVRDTAIGSTAPNSPPDSGSAWRPRKQAQARPVPASPLFPNKAHAGPHLDLRSVWGAPGAPKYTLNASRTRSAATLKNELA